MERTLDDRRLQCAWRRFAAPSTISTISAALLIATGGAGPYRVPADVVAAFHHAGPEPDAPPGGTRGALAAAGLLANLAYQTGVLSQVDPETRFWLDVIASLPVVLEHPHTVALLDIRAQPRGEGGHRLAGLQAALIVHTGGRNDAVARRIQQLLSTHTNSQKSNLTTRNENGETWYILRDRRLPEWATITWGAVAGDYVIAIGDGAFERLADVARGREPSLDDDPWVGEALSAVRGEEAVFGWYLNVDRLRQTEDELLVAKIARVQESLTLGDVHRGLWAVRYEHPQRKAGKEQASSTNNEEPTTKNQIPSTVDQVPLSVQIDGFVRRGDRDVHRPIADSALLERISDPVVPEEATSFAVLACSPAGLLDTIGAGYLAARSPAGREHILEFWKDVQDRAGVSIDDDLMAHLGDLVVVHDYPPHALGLPLMWTILVKIERDPAGLRQSVDRLLRFVQSELERTGTVRLARDPDGVWFVQFGIQGPALTVTERWLVLSFSPQALRMNVARLDSKKRRSAVPNE